MSSPLADTGLAERELESALRQASRTHRREQLARIGRDGVVWLAVAPSWTMRLARECGLPTGSRSLEEFVAAASAARLCVSTDPPRTGARRDRELRVLVALGAELPRPFVDRALELLERASDRVLAGALVDLAPAVEGPSHARAVQLSGRIEDPIDRATAQIALLPELVGHSAWLDYILTAKSRDAAPAASARLLTRLAATDTREASRNHLAHAALHAALRIRSPDERALALAQLPPLLGKRRQADFLRAIRPLDPALRVELLLAAAPYLPRPRRKPLAEAIPWIAEIRDAPGRTAARLALTAALAGAGDLAAAEAQARRIEEDDARARAFGELAAATIAAGGGDDAIEAPLQLARRSLEETAGGWVGVSARCAIAESVRSAGDDARALALAEEALERTRELGATAEGFTPLVSLATLFRALGELDAAHAVAARAHAIAARLGGPRERCEPLLLVAPLLDERRAAETLDAARAALAAIADPLDRAALLPLFLRSVPSAEGDELVEATRALAADVETERTFWMPEPTRSEILSVVAEPGPDGEPAVDVVGIVAQVGSAIAAAAAQGVPVPAPLQRWSLLAAVAGGGAAAHAYLAHFAGALDAGDVATALDWVETGAVLAVTLGDDALASAVRYTRRRMELVHREAQDRRSPELFLERAELTAAFAALREDDGSAWALHYVGQGGVGKSSLLRHLARRARAEDVVTAKVDFDYLSPDYPVRKPAQLLIELMAELELHATTPRAEAVVQRFRDAAVRLHEESADGPSGDSLAQLDGPQFSSVLRGFCDFLAVLGKPVVLFLDTCEELARFQPDGAPARNVDAAFGAIERIHDAFPSVRVVFAGRRLLARRGWGWRAASGPGLAQTPRPYLRLHRIGGFTDVEARTFLHSITMLELAPPLEDAILKGSPQPRSRGERVDWEPPRPDDDGGRYNPFDLAMYAEWIAEEGAVAPEAIASDSADPYVDLRIVGRIRQDRLPGLRELLPAVALLQRFDAPLLRPAFPGSDDDFGRIVAELGQQEWIARVDRGDGGPRELVVDANLRPRLLAYYRQHSRAGQLEEARAALARGVRDRLASEPLGRLTPEHLEAAVDVLEPADFTARWHGLVAKAAAAERWDWLERVAGRLLGDEGVLRGRAHVAYAAVTAAFASAQLHERAEPGLAAHWRAVLETAARDPDPDAATWLRARGEAGVLAATPDPAAQQERLPDFLSLLLLAPNRRWAQQDELHAHRCEQLAAACCAALDALEAQPWDVPEKLRAGRQIAAWARRLGAMAVPADVRAAAHVAGARWLVAEGHPADARRELDAAKRCAADVATQGSRRWLDWLAPASPRDRVRLEAVRLGLPPELATLKRWSAEAEERIASVDGERLLSAILDLRLAHGLVDAEELVRLERLDSYDPARRGVSGAHRAVRPLFATVALGWLARGDAPRALGRLEQHRAAAMQSAADPATVRAAELTTLALLRRMRSVDERPLVDKLARSADPAERAAALAVIALTRSPVQPESGDVVPWRFQVGLSWSRQDRLRTLGAERWHGGHEPDGAEERLDRAEHLRLTGASGDRGPRVELRAARLPGEREHAVRLGLRAAALGALAGPDLGAEPFRHGGPLWDALPDLGPRRLAEVALEEGELLALRLPHDAVPLLACAADWFRRAGDPLGALLATIRCTLALAHARLPARDGPERELTSAFGAAAAAGLFPSEPDPDRVWAPWQERLTLARHWCAGGRRTEEAEGRADPPPVELDLDPWGERRTPRWRSILGTASLFLYGFAVAVAALLGVPWLVQQGLGFASVDVSFLASVALWAGAVALAVALNGMLNALGRDLSAAAAARTAMRLTVDGGAEASEIPWPEPRPVSLTLRQRRAGAAEDRSARRVALDYMADAWRRVRRGETPRLLRLDETAETTAAAETPPLQPYASAAATLPPDLALAVVETLAAARKAPVALALELPPALMGLPWEGFLAAAAGSTGAAVERLHLFRHDPRSEPAPRGPGEGTEVVVVARRTWRRLTSEGWSDWSGPVRYADDGVGVFLAGPPRVLHAIGRPVSGTSGQLLQIAADESRGASVEESVRGSGSLLEPNELRGGGGTLVIVQAEPLEIAGRLDTDREEAAKLRLFAAGVFAAGAHAVLAVPALPPELATELIRSGARRVQRGERFDVWTAMQEPVLRWFGVRSDPQLRALLGAVAELRTLIAGWPGADLESCAELASDVCLFARTDLPEFGVAAPSRFGKMFTR